MGDGDGFAAGINRANSVNPGAALPGQDDISEAFTDRRVRAALAFMESGLASGLSVSVVASRVGLSRSRFEHIFKAQTGGTFREVVRVMRLARARKLLRDLVCASRKSPLNVVTPPHQTSLGNSGASSPQLPHAIDVAGQANK